MPEHYFAITNKRAKLYATYPDKVDVDMFREYVQCLLSQDHGRFAEEWKIVSGLLRQGKLKSAIPLLRQLENLYPDSYCVKSTLGDILKDIGCPQAAVKYFAEASGVAQVTSLYFQAKCRELVAWGILSDSYLEQQDFKGVALAFMGAGLAYRAAQPARIAAFSEDAIAFEFTHACLLRNGLGVAINMHEQVDDKRGNIRSMHSFIDMAHATKELSQLLCKIYEVPVGAQYEKFDQEMSALEQKVDLLMV